MITFGNVAQANANGIIVTIKGDGILASLKFAINKAPFNLVNIAPDSVLVDTQQQGLTATGVITTVLLDTILTLTFNNPVPVAGIAPSIAFIYNSLP